MNKITGVSTIIFLIVIIVVGIIESVPPPMGEEKIVTVDRQHMMRVAMIGEFSTTIHDDGSTTTERPVFVGDINGEMFNVYDYHPDFKGDLKEGDRVYVTITSTQNATGYSRISHVRIDTLITEEDLLNAE